MNAEGRACRMYIRYEETLTSLPFIEETIRTDPILEHHEPLLGERRPAPAFHRGGVPAGCLTVRPTRSTTPLLLYLALGKRTEALHVPETRGLFYRDLFIQESPGEMPEFSIIVDRQSETIEYRGCRITGFELRASIPDPLVLRLDITGENVHQSPLYTAPEDPPYEEPFDLDMAEILLDENSGTHYYGFSLALAAEPARGDTRVTLTLNAALNEELGRLSDWNTHAVRARFRTRDEEYEPNRKTGFDLSADGLILTRSQKETDNADEILSPFTFSCCGDLIIRTYETGERS